MQDEPSGPTPDLKALRRFLQILYFTLFATLGLYWVVLEQLAAEIKPAELGFLKTALAACAAGTGGIVLYVRFSRIGPLLAETTSDLNQRSARLRASYILCYALSEAVALWGFMVRVLGGERAEAIPFFLGAVVLFLLCYPRLPETH